MIAIQKRAELTELMRLRQQAIAYGLSPKDAYATLRKPLKSKVRDNLVEEQGQLCAYCMCRIPRADADPHITSIIIEHVVPRDPTNRRDSGQGLDYDNFVAVCYGNKGPHGTRTIVDLTCDAHKGNLEFKKISPCKPNTLESIFYTTDGKIDASDPDVKSDLLHVLNLNCPSSPLVAERKAALDSLIADIAREIEDTQKLLSYCTAVLESFKTETDTKTPYVGILVWYLETMSTVLNVT